MPLELEKKRFYLKTLHEASRELPSFIQPKKILDAFLLTAMGPLGIAFGFAALLHTPSKSGTVTSRGMTAAEATGMENSIPAICDRYFSWTNDDAVASPRPLIVDNAAEIADPAIFPSGTRMLVLWNVDNQFSGVVGFGAPFTGQELDEDGLELLHGLVNILIGAVAHALATQSIHQLNADLEKKNRSLQSALDEAQETRGRLDRSLFHLNALNDLSVELSQISETRKLLEAFLLTAIGTFSVRSGVAIVYDRSARKVCTVARGVENAPQLDAAAFEACYLRLLEVCEDKKMAPMSKSWIQTPAIFDDFGFSMGTQVALAFVVDTSLIGFLALGPSLSAGTLPPAEEDLLLTYVSTFMVYCRNVHAYEAIGALNDDLKQRNIALEAAIRALSEARQKIDLLEKAKAHIKALVHKELQRTGHASVLDFILILAFAVIVGILFNGASPNGIPLLSESMSQSESPRIQAAEARFLLDAGRAVLVDARPRALFEREHIPAAVNLTPALFDIVYMMHLSRVSLEQSIIVYGRTVSRHYDAVVAQRLRQRDHEKVMVLDGGLAAWERQGYPVER
ncbi:MAG: rhodanese-like domain-containing protein [Pseudomonadota bacterium]